MPQIFTSDDDFRREERDQLGNGVVFSFYSNTLQPTQPDKQSSFSYALQVNKRDHLDISAQQNKLARIMRIITIVGFAVVVANIVVITQITDLTSRIVLGTTTALVLALVSYFRSTIMPVNRELLAYRKDIRTSAAQFEQRERDIEMLRPLLAADPEAFQATWEVLDDKRTRPNM